MKYKITSYSYDDGTLKNFFDYFISDYSKEIEEEFPNKEELLVSLGNEIAAKKTSENIKIILTSYQTEKYVIVMFLNENGFIHGMKNPAEMIFQIKDLKKFVLHTCFWWYNGNNGIIRSEVIDNLKFFHGEEYIILSDINTEGNWWRLKVLNSKSVKEYQYYTLSERHQKK